MRSAELLTNYLVELDRRGWDFDEFVSQHPEMSAALRDLLRVADRLRRTAQPVPSEAFRQRSRRRFATAFVPPPSRRRWYGLSIAWRPYRPLIVPVAAGMLLVFGLGGALSASAKALPNSPFYSTKLAIERAEIITAISADRRAEVHLAIARERLREAALEQEQGNITAAQALIQGSDSEVAKAQAVVQAYSPPTVVATAVANTAAQVRDERRQIATRVVALPVTTQSPKAVDDVTGHAPGNVAEDATPVAPVHARTDSAVQPSSPHGDVKSDGAPDIHQTPGKPNSHDSQPLHSSGNDDNGAATAGDSTDVRASSRSGPTPAPTPARNGAESPGSQADQLIHTLVIQATQGDPASQQTEDRYLEVIRSVHSGGAAWRAKLTDQRHLVEKAIPAAPPSTRPVLQSLLQELNHVVGPPDQGPDARSGASTTAGGLTDSTNALASRDGKVRSYPAGKSNGGS